MKPESSVPRRQAAETREVPRLAARPVEVLEAELEKLEDYLGRLPGVLAREDARILSEVREVSLEPFEKGALWKLLRRLESERRDPLERSGLVAGVARDILRWALGRPGGDLARVFGASAHDLDVLPTDRRLRLQTLLDVRDVAGKWHDFATEVFLETKERLEAGQEDALQVEADPAYGKALSRSIVSACAVSTVLWTMGDRAGEPVAVLTPLDGTATGPL